ncbi:MAG TPA: orotate phosphoribosyltransferase [Acidimicrobiales bacterium]|nr:orotate phosphoribosyltransferase [Acidimicrobiales bacterium]
MTSRLQIELTEPLRTDLLNVIEERGYSHRVEPFRLSSGGLSHDYVDMRRAVSRGKDLELAARGVIKALEIATIDFSAIGGMTMGADPVAHAVALITKTNWFSVRKAEKDHGSKRRIEGAEVGAGTRVVAFEDTVSTGRSVLEAIDVLERTGAEVIAACTLLDRGDRATEEFAKRSVPYFALFTYRDLNIEPIA